MGTMQNLCYPGKMYISNSSMGDRCAQLKGALRLCCRTREVELQLLKAAVAERDIRLRIAKTELMTTQATLKDKDAELLVRIHQDSFPQCRRSHNVAGPRMSQGCFACDCLCASCICSAQAHLSCIPLQTAFQQLMAAAGERGQVRQQLLDTQQELAETRSELEIWTQEASISGREGGDSASATKQPLNGSLKPASDQRGNEVAKLLADLTRLSQQVADDALADEAVFKDAAAS